MSSKFGCSFAVLSFFTRVYSFYSLISLFDLVLVLGLLKSDFRGSYILFRQFKNWLIMVLILKNVIKGDTLHLCMPAGRNFMFLRHCHDSLCPEVETRGSKHPIGLFCLGICNSVVLLCNKLNQRHFSCWCHACILLNSILQAQFYHIDIIQLVFY